MTIVYLIFIIQTLIYSIKYDRIDTNDSHKNHRFWLMCGFLICLSGFSYGLGGDKFVYMEEFEEYITEDFSYWPVIISQNFILRSQMPLWTLLNLIIKHICNSFYVVQFAQAIIVNITFCYIVQKYTKRIFLFLLLYFLSLNFLIFNTEIMREGIAVALGLLGIDAWLNDKKYIFWIFTVLACLFHVSAFILILFPFLNLPINKRTIFWWWGIAFTGWLLSDIMINIIIPLVLGGQGQLMMKVVQYSSIASTIFGFLSKSIQYIILPFVVMLFTIQSEKDPIRKKKFQKIMSFYIVIAIIATSIAGLSRFRNYTMVFMLIWVAEFIYASFVSQKHLIIRIGTIIGISYFVMKFAFSYYPINKKIFIQYYVPYTCILNEDADVYFREQLHSETSGDANANSKNTRTIKF